MKPAISVRLDDLVAAARRLQHVIDAERPEAILPAALLCRLARDVDDAASRLQRQAEVISVASAARHEKV
jgi:hypothetical protein